MPGIMDWPRPHDQEPPVNRPEEGLRQGDETIVCDVCGAPWAVGNAELPGGWCSKNRAHVIRRVMPAAPIMVERGEWRDGSWHLLPWRKPKGRPELGASPEAARALQDMGLMAEALCQAIAEAKAACDRDRAPYDQAVQQASLAGEGMVPKLESGFARAGLRLQEIALSEGGDVSLDNALPSLLPSLRTLAALADSVRVPEEAKR